MVRPSRNLSNARRAAPPDSPARDLAEDLDRLASAAAGLAAALRRDPVPPAPVPAAAGGGPR